MPGEIKIPRSGDGAKARFLELVPADAAGVTVRPMFGNQAGFVNGNMFTGLFGERLFVRLDPTAEAELKAAGGTDFEPMPGRPMRGYTYLPDGWQDAPEQTTRWLDAALKFAAALPAKAPKPKKTAKTKT